MKTLYLAVTLASLFTGPCSAQEIKTVSACRAYRDAWTTSLVEDMRRLSVGELVQRADQMMSCRTDFDTRPFAAGMTVDDVVKAAHDQMGYPELAAIYTKEAFNRASRFLENKGLTREFSRVAAGEKTNQK